MTDYSEEPREEKETATPRIPEYLYEQQMILPRDLDTRELITQSLYAEVKAVLSAAGIEIIDSTCRTKTTESIKRKESNRDSLNHILVMFDIFGVRFILNEQDIDLAVQALIAHFNPPNQYTSSGYSVESPAVCDYRIKTKPRPKFRLPSYQAVHLRVPFGQVQDPLDKGEFLRHLGEIQLWTPQVQRTAERNRRYYERRQGRSHTR
jgi:hypothetical protein